MVQSHPEHLAEMHVHLSEGLQSYFGLATDLATSMCTVAVINLPRDALIAPSPSRDLRSILRGCSWHAQRLRTQTPVHGDIEIIALPCRRFSPNTTVSALTPFQLQLQVYVVLVHAHAVTLFSHSLVMCHMAPLTPMACRAA